MKENYRKCIKRRSSETRSGSKAKTLATCQFFKELSFLRDVVSNRNTESNVPEACYQGPSSGPSAPMEQQFDENFNFSLNQTNDEGDTRSNSPTVTPLKTERSKRKKII